MRKLYLNTFVVALVTSFWSCVYYFDSPYLEGSIKPFVYRALVPFLVRCIEFVGVPAEISLVLIMTLSGVGFYLALRKWALDFTDLTDVQELGIVVGVVFAMLLLGEWRTPYDLMTAFLFTLAFRFIYTVKVWKYMAIFVLACLNRETAFLLIIISAITWYPRYSLDRLSDILQSNWLNIVAWQVVIFTAITYTIRLWFADYPGLSLWINQLENIQQIVSHLYQLVWIIFIVSIVALWMFRKPQYAFLDMSFIVLIPILLVMWIVCGQWGEPRVFWEAVPVVILLMVL